MNGFTGISACVRCSITDRNIANITDRDTVCREHDVATSILLVTLLLACFFALPQSVFAQTEGGTEPAKLTSVQIAVERAPEISDGTGGMRLAAQWNHDSGLNADQGIPDGSGQLVDEDSMHLNPTNSRELKTAVHSAFATSHGGWSCDEVILNDRLHTAFIAAVQLELPGTTVEEACWTLLNLRKAGKLNVETTRRSPSNSGDDLGHIAEIAARTVQDRFGVSTDRIMSSPEMRAEFDAIVIEIDGAIDTYQARRAAFRMRKTRKLKPELITRIADWSRTIESYSGAAILENPELIQQHPGVYIFRDASGYLYIGQTENLRERLATHLDQSHSQSLASYLTAHGADSITIEVHDFDPESRARETMIRRAYESELIASRKPRFNIQP